MAKTLKIGKDMVTVPMRGYSPASDTILLERLIDSINSTLSLLQDNDNMTAGEAITMITQVTDLVTRVHLGIDPLPANW